MGKLRELINWAMREQIRTIKIEYEPLVCKVCGTPYKTITYPRIGPVHGVRKVPNCDCIQKEEEGNCLPIGE